MRTFPIMLATVVIATPATAQLRPLVEPPASAAAAAREGVEVFLINEGTTAVPALGPAEIDTVARDGQPLRLIAAPDEPLTVQPGGFARLHYRLAAAGGTVAVAATPVPVQATSPGPPTETVSQTSAGSSSAFGDRIHPHEPVYGAFGTGDAGGKVQLSFAVRLLGRPDGINLTGAYTQTMFWKLGQPSGPIRPTTYSPEIFVDVPLGKSMLLGFGYRHDSNGEATAISIDANRLFVRATQTFDLGSDWYLDVTPKAWIFVANQGVARDLDRYWGYTSLGVAVGQDDGLKVAGTLRGNPGTGKGAGELFVSYPLTRLGPAGVYLFGQAFTGYGEALSNYNKRDSHARLGIAFTR